jgi:large subunit ribosomal protein L2
MGYKSFRPTTPSRRFMTVPDFSELSKKRPERGLIEKISRSTGRNNHGNETNINTGGGHKRLYRIIDFRRDKRNIAAKVAAIEYDPNRTSRIALLQYLDGEKRYILAPIGLQVGATVLTGEGADIKPGNALPLRNIPAGQIVHAIELKAGKGAAMVRSAGVGAQIRSKEGEYAQIRLPSGEVRNVHLDCYATIGTVGNPEHQNMVIGKAGRNRWKGIRPHNRGTAKNPVDHPLGGGQGKTKGGRHPCSRTGQLAKGLMTRNNKRTDKFILQRRKSKTQMKQG